MKVCLVSRYFDFRNAGLGRVGLKIKEGLQEKGHEVHTVSTEGVSLYSYFAYTALSLPFKLPKGYDIYHAITPMEAIWLPKDKSVCTFHDLFQITDPDKLGSGLGNSSWKNRVGCSYFKLAVNISKRCKGITAVSNKTANEVMYHLGIPYEKIKVIKSGINDSLEPLKVAKGKGLTVGYLGQLDRRKRVSLLIESFKRSSLNKLIIAGTGVDERDLKGLARGDKRITFTGRISDEELGKFYSSLDAFIFPTWIEGYGLPIVEAMACKVPVVVLEDSYIPEEIKSKCIVVNNLDTVFSSEEYLRSLIKLNKTEDNYKFAKSHSWDIATNSYLKVYEEVLGGY